MTDPTDIRSVAAEFLQEARADEQGRKPVAEAKALWSELHPTGPTWDELTAQQREFGVLTFRLIDNPDERRREQIAAGIDPGPPDEPRYACHLCLDRLTITRPLWRRGVFVGDVGWFCTCYQAINACARYWFRHLYPTKVEQNDRQPNSKALISYRRYEKLWREQAARVRPVIDNLLDSTLPPKREQERES